MTQIILSGKPVNADVEAAPVGAYDVIRGDVRQLSTVQPVNRVFIERTDTGYRGILFSNERPHLFALNGNGFTSKPIQDGPQVLSYCVRLEDDERALTAELDARRADGDMDAFNDLMDAGGYIDPRNYVRVRTAIVEEGPVETIRVWGPPNTDDPIERVPGAYRKMMASAREGKESSGICGGGVVMNTEGKVLLVKPRDGYGGYDWTFPKGYPAQIDEGHREQTAVREVREESGYRVFARRFLGRFTHNDGGTCDYFVCDVDGSKPVGKPDPFETSDVKWVTVVEALELLNDDVDVRILAQANNLLPKLLIKGGPHSGTMIALHLPADVAKQLALPGGEEAASLHITLAYLGKGLSEDQKKTAASVVRRFAGTIIDGIRVTLGGVGRFSASDSSEGRDVVYLSVDSPQLTRIRPWLMDDLAEAGIAPAETHGFVPHVTLTYIDKEAETPLKRFEPIAIKFDTISLTIADQQMSFPLKLSAENQKWHDIAVRNSEALKLFVKTQPDVEKAERNVKEPGKFGAHFWIDAKNQVRYDERPTSRPTGNAMDASERSNRLDEDKKASLRDELDKHGWVTCPHCGWIGVGVTKGGRIHKHGRKQTTGEGSGCSGGGLSILAGEDPNPPEMGTPKRVRKKREKKDTRTEAERALDRVAEETKKTIYVHTNAMGVRFLRHTSDHEVDDENQAVVRYAPFGKNIDGLSQGEVHYIFDELYHSKAKTMDEFLKEAVEPVWDDEGGKNPFTLEKARTWMEHTLTYLEYDNDVAPGGKDLLHGRKDVDWKDFHEALKFLPSTQEQSAKEEYKDSQKAVRDYVRTILAHFGITKPPMGRGMPLDWSDRFVVSTEREIGAGTAAAFHGWMGEVHISANVHNGLLKFAEAMVNDDGKLRSGNALYAMRCLLHEELHGFSEMKPYAYEGVGMLVEEVTTEVTARMVMRERFGHMRDVTDPTVSTLTGPGLMARNEEHTMLPSSGGSYGKIIDECIMIVAEVLAERHESAKTDFPRPPQMFKDEAKHTLEQACLQFKKHHIGHETGNPHQHLNDFTRSFKTLTFTEQSKVANEIDRLVQAKRKLGKMARE